jgi:hypothetical protein
MTVDSMEEVAMDNQNRPPQDNTLFTFAVLMVLGLVSWGLAAAIWYLAYLWFEEVTPPTFVITLLALPLPFLAYRSFRQSSQPRSAESEDFLTWLGKGQPYNGVMVLLIMVFWSLLYWSWQGIEFNTLTFGSWGLLTIFGYFFIRNAILKRPGKEVPAGETSKSQS